MKNFKIAIIDSGLGGLSLFRAFLKELNIKNYIYFADLKNLPYGTKSQKELQLITIKNVKNIITRYKPNVIVFGCNTIGTTIYNDIKKIFSQVSIFAIKPCLSNNLVLDKRKKTLVIATTATIKALEKTKEYLKNKNRIILCKMPKLACKVEDYIQNGSNIMPYLSKKSIVTLFGLLTLQNLFGIERQPSLPV